jgi:hypothetical protein
MKRIRAGELKIGQKFKTLLTNRRGVVEDIRSIIDHGEGGSTEVQSGPRVFLLGKGLTHVTLHPDVLVGVEE